MRTQTTKVLAKNKKCGHKRKKCGHKRQKCWQKIKNADTNDKIDDNSAYKMLFIIGLLCGCAFFCDIFCFFCNKTHKGRKGLHGFVFFWRENGVYYWIIVTTTLSVMTEITTVETLKKFEQINPNGANPNNLLGGHRLYQNARKGLARRSF